MAAISGIMKILMCMMLSIAFEKEVEKYNSPHVIKMKNKKMSKKFLLLTRSKKVYLAILNMALLLLS